MTMSEGITYVAWGKCLYEAEESAKSALKFGINTCLITPEKIKSKVFNKIITTNIKVTKNFNIVNNYNLSPWDITLWLDSDTLILGDLSFAFKMAKIHGIVTVIAPHSSIHGRGLKGIPNDAPEYNCGAFWVDRTHPSGQVLGSNWKKIVDEYKHDGWWTDQSSLSYALYNLNICPYVLPLNWNFRAFMNREFSHHEYHTDHGYGPIKIWHSRSKVTGIKTFPNKFWYLKEPLYKKIFYRFMKIPTG